MRYFIAETQITSSDDVNFVKTEKYTLATALSYYYSRMAAYIVDTTYKAAHIMLTDEGLNVIKKDDITTQYKEA